MMIYGIFSAVCIVAFIAFVIGVQIRDAKRLNGDME